jgi:hypothetical protein
MERLRPAPPSASEVSVLTGLESPQGTPSLHDLLEAVRSPGVMKSDVDALLRGLALPVAGDESPLMRADFLLALVESSDVGPLEGSDGCTVRVAAVEALLELGYPHALQVPPDALEEARRARAGPEPRDVPIVGLCAALVAVVVQCGVSMDGVSWLMQDSSTNVGKLLGVLLLSMLLGPSVSAALGGWLRLRALQTLGVVTMMLAAVGWLGVGVLAFSFTSATGIAISSLIAGLALGSGSVLLNNPEWLKKDPEPVDSGERLFSSI